MTERYRSPWLYTIVIVGCLLIIASALFWRGIAGENKVIERLDHITELLEK